MRFGSLFAGIGGIDLGLEWAGMECAWQVEIDPYCQRVLEKHWPNMRRFGDVKECGKENLERVDLICGGFPCQPHSVAGKQKGAEDDRNLWPEFSRIIAELRPCYVLAENVPGIITTYLDAVLSDLKSQGYICATLNLPAVAFDAPHRRHRIFIVAYWSKQRRSLAHNDTRRSLNAIQARRDAVRNGGEDVVDANQSGSQGHGGLYSERDCACQFAPWACCRAHEDERLARSGICRISHGVPSRVDRLRCLGNAVVPQVAEWIGKRIIEREALKEAERL